MPKPTHPRTSPAATVVSLKPAIAHVRSATDHRIRTEPLIRHRRLLHVREVGGRLRGNRVHAKSPGNRAPRRASYRPAPRKTRPMSPEMIRIVISSKWESPNNAVSRTARKLPRATIAAGQKPVSLDGFVMYREAE